MLVAPDGEREGVMSLQDTVLNHGFCIGCGVCTAVPGSPYRVERNRYGLRQAVRHGEETPGLEDVLERVCPFGAHAPDEDALQDRYFGTAVKKAKYLGRYLQTFAGSVEDADRRSRASSGGIGRWLLAELLERGMVDAVVQVNENPNGAGQPLFRYDVVRDAPGLLSAARSAYYPTSLDEVLAVMAQQPGRYAITGVPCFIKALRLLCLEDESLRKRIVYTIGIVCGHMKSEAYAEMIAWQLGIPPGTLEEIDFRGKTEGKRASIKNNIVRSGTTARSAFTKDLFGTSYSLGFFKPKACDFCDDVLAETADVSIGDAWLPQYVNDSRGTSIVVVRNPDLLSLLESGAAAGQLKLDAIPPSEIVKSQQGGLRHRNEGLAYRLWKHGKENSWFPPKRTKPGPFAFLKSRQGLYDLRYAIASQSHEAFLNAKQRRDFSHFVSAMKPLVDQHDRLYKRKNRLARLWKQKSRGGRPKSKAA